MATRATTAGKSTRALANLLAVWVIFAACTIDHGGNGLLEAEPDAELVAQFKSGAVRWIRAERELARPLAASLSERDRLALAAYFPARVLDRARVLVVEDFDNPAFFSIFEEHGEPHPVDLRRASGLALIDTILIAKVAAGSARRDRLLFHELVHLMQYDILGLEAYMEGYVESWSENGRSYRAIPHEAQAFELASRFGAGGEPFSAEAEVRSRFLIPVAVSTARD